MAGGFPLVQSNRDLVRVQLPERGQFLRVSEGQAGAPDLAGCLEPPL